jgi:YD repeat-containing protein
VVKQDSLGDYRFEERNILGQIVSVQSALNATAYYSYDPLNNLVKIVDPHGVATVLNYNINNQIVFKDDPYMGASQNSYNAFNELISTTFANGQTVYYYRDVLGRLIRRSEPEGVTTWTYDTALNGVGKLNKVNTSSVVKEYSYDSFGREIEVKSVIKASNYSIRTQYDIYGRVNAISYPSNTNGFMTAVSLNDSLCKSYVWKASDYDAMKNLLKEENQNGITTSYGYNGYSQVTGIKTESKINNLISRSFVYEYDLRKNLIKKTDNDFRGKN